MGKVTSIRKFDATPIISKNLQSAYKAISKGFQSISPQSDYKVIRNSFVSINLQSTLKALGGICGVINPGRARTRGLYPGKYMTEREGLLVTRWLTESSAYHS